MLRVIWNYLRPKYHCDIFDKSKVIRKCRVNSRIGPLDRVSFYLADPMDALTSTGEVVTPTKINTAARRETPTVASN